jgi:hypothetical protein
MMDRTAKPESRRATEIFIVQSQCGGTQFAGKVVHDTWFRFAFRQCVILGEYAAKGPSLASNCRSARDRRISGNGRLSVPCCVIL